MIVYNVTCHMSLDMAAEWLAWMQQVHIPEVMSKGCFIDHKIMRILTNVEDDEGVNYSVQYSAPDMDAYEKYRSDFAPALQQKTRERYGEKVLAFRTLLEVVE
jgi:hypothetical protein